MQPGQGREPPSRVTVLWVTSQLLYTYDVLIEQLAQVDWNEKQWGNGCREKSGKMMAQAQPRSTRLTQQHHIASARFPSAHELGVHRTCERPKSDFREPHPLNRAHTRRRRARRPAAGSGGRALLAASAAAVVPSSLPAPLLPKAQSALSPRFSHTAQDANRQGVPPPRAKRPRVLVFFWLSAGCLCQEGVGGGRGGGSSANASRQRPPPPPSPRPDTRCSRGAENINKTTNDPHSSALQ